MLNSGNVRPLTREIASYWKGISNNDGTMAILMIFMTWLVVVTGDVIVTNHLDKGFLAISSSVVNVLMVMGR